MTLVPYIKGSGEHKSKPTQHSVKELRSIGISPDIIIARADEKIDQGVLDKIALFCNVKPDCVIENLTLPCLYEAPLMLHQNGLDQVVCRELSLHTPQPDLEQWEKMVEKVKSRDRSVRIAIVGKYIRLHDAYLSIVESLNHAGYEHGVRVELDWVDSEELEQADVADVLSGVQGILIPGGFGDRGILGKILACQYAREHNVPYFGICLGMQIAVIEFARNVCGMADAHSREFDGNSAHLVIDLMEEQRNITEKGGTMRLGAYPCKIVKGTVMEQAYGCCAISERHRHRYEFNNDYREIMESKGLRICGTSPDNALVEAVELPQNDFFIGVQFHPEFKSRPNRPHPLFLKFVESALQKG